MNKTKQTNKKILTKEKKKNIFLNVKMTKFET